MKLLCMLVGMGVATSIHCTTEPGHRTLDLIVQTHVYEASEDALFHKIFNHHLCSVNMGEEITLHSAKLAQKEESSKRTDYLQLTVEIGNSEEKVLEHL